MSSSFQENAAAPASLLRGEARRGLLLDAENFLSKEFFRQKFYWNEFQASSFLISCYQVSFLHISFTVPYGAGKCTFVLFVFHANSWGLTSSYFYDTIDNAGYWTGIDWNQYDAVMKWASSRKTLHVETRLLSDVCYIYIYDRLEYMKAQISMLFRYAESDMFFLSDKNSKSVKESVMDYFYKADRALDYLKICGTEEDVSVYGSKVQQIAEMVESIA